MKVSEVKLRDLLGNGEELGLHAPGQLVLALGVGHLNSLPPPPPYHGVGRRTSARNSAAAEAAWVARLSALTFPVLCISRPLGGGRRGGDC